MKRWCIVLIYFLLGSFVASAQQSTMPMRMYSAKEYGGFPQVWTAAQDSTGSIWFGTSSNVFHYDGTTWTPVKVSNGTAIRSLRIGSDGVVYVGGIGTFGYIATDARGNFNYVSLVKELPDSARSFADVWKIYEVNGEVVFQTSAYVYFFKDKKLVHVLSPEHTFAFSFFCNNRLFIRQREIGLMEIRDHRLFSIPGGERFAKERVLEILPENPKVKNGSMLVLTGDSGFYRMKPVCLTGSDIQPISFPSTATLTNSFILNAGWIGDSIMGVGTSQGYYILRPNGDIRDTINMSVGLLDNNVSFALQDRDHLTWLCTGQGIAKINLSKSTRYYSSQNGVTGEINSICSFQNSIYLGSMDGVLKFFPAQNRFEKIDFPSREIWQLKATSEYLYICTSNGLFSLDKNNVLNQITDTYCRDVLIYATSLFVGERDGVRVMQRDVHGVWTTAAYRNIPAEEFYSLQIDPYAKLGENSCWGIGKNTNSAYRFQWIDTTIQAARYDSTNGIHSSMRDIIVLDKQIYLCTEDLSYKYHPELDKHAKSVCFVLTPILSENNISHVFSYSISGEFNGHIFGGDRKAGLDFIRTYSFYGLDSLTGMYRVFKAPISELIGEDFIESYREPSGNFWISASGQIIHYSIADSLIQRSPYRVYIRKVLGKNDTLLFSGFSTSRQFTNDIAYGFNDLTITFAAPFFDHEELTHYQTWLEGYEDHWSGWTTNKQRIFGNLPEGDYRFHVRAATLHGDDCPETIFSFHISPPWYRSIWAYILYAIGFILLVVGIVYISLRRLRRHKRVLENLVRERTQEVSLQKEKLQLAIGDMRDSINYAKRIQDALLPPKSLYQKHLPDSFVFLSPKDIVSGDFHWLDERDGKIYIAAADCTGHGVPGALMSVVGFNLLDQALNESGLRKPAEILSHLDRGVNKLLRQSDHNSEVKDGMDIALCSFDPKTYQLEYAGAFNPLYWIRKGKLYQIKADKDPIGSNEHGVTDVYTNHTVQLEPGDFVYIFSDGYADQFGGPFGKKFKYAPFRDLLLDIYQLSVEEQHARISTVFFEWKQDLEQVDDVLVIGIRV